MEKPGKSRLKVLVLTSHSSKVNPYFILANPVDANSSASFGGLEPAPLPFELELITCQQESEAVMQVIDACKQGDPFAVAFIDQAIPHDMYRAVEKFRARDPELEMAIIADDPEESIALVSGIIPAEKLLLLKRPLYGAEIRQAALTLGVKWINERRLRNNEQIILDLVTKVDILEKENQKRKMIEAGIQKSRELFYAFLRHLPAIAFIKDCKGRYVYINEACTKSLKQKPVDFIGKTDKELWPQAMAQQIILADQRALSNIEAVTDIERFEIQAAEKCFKTTRFPIIKNGKVFFLAGVSFDITADMEKQPANAKLTMPADGVDSDAETLPEPFAPINQRCSALPKHEISYHQIPDALPGLSIKTALERLGGAFTLYIDLVAFLCKDKSRTSAEIREMARLKEFEAAMVKAHSLKGSAATIGAEDLTEAAKALENACREQKIHEIDGLLEQLDQRLAQVLDSSNLLIRMFPELAPEEDVRRVFLSENKPLAAVFELDACLEQCDPLCAEQCMDKLMAAVASLDHNPPEPAWVENIRALIKKYDYDAARNLLCQLKSNLMQNWRAASNQALPLNAVTPAAIDANANLPQNDTPAERDNHGRNQQL